jgi:uncharacterized protein
VYVSSLHVYPVKGCRAADVAEAAVEPWGLRGDRRWMVVNEDGRFQSQRECPGLATIVPRLVPGGVELTAPGVPPLTVLEPTPASSMLVPVRVWKATFEAVAAAEDAHAWVFEVLGAPLRLVWLDDPLRRPPHPVAGARATFADGFPLLVTNEGSLDALNDWLVEVGEEPVPMNRFRPNLVVSGADSWAEDHWWGMRAPDLEVRTAKPCGRCVVTTTDQATGERLGRQPLAILARRHRIGADAAFGINVAPLAAGKVRVGDPVAPVRD